MKSASRVALFAAAGLFVGGVAMPSAKAADLGGDCCADLEERVAELEATTARKGNRRQSLTVSGQVNRAMMYWDDRVDSGLFSVDNSMSRSGFQFDGSAKINPNLTAGFQLVIGLSSGARGHHVRQTDDDGYPPTPVGPGGETISVSTGTVTPSAPVGGAGTATRIASIPQTGYSGGDGTLGVELANWYIRHDTLGELRLGRINSSSAGVTSVDLAGTAVIANSNFGLWNAGMYMNFNGAPTAFSWNTIFGGSIVSIAGLSRQDGITYTTPTLAGFSLSASFQEGLGAGINQGAWDVAGRYAGEFSGFRIAAAVGYCVNCGFVNDVSDGGNGVTFTTAAIDERSDVRQLKGSASVMHVPSGLFVQGAAARFSYGGPTAGEINSFSGGGLVAGQNRPDTTFWYLQGGISQNWTGLGKTVLYGEYGRIDGGADGLTVNGDSVFNSRASFWGIGLVQNIDAAAMELYLAYRNYSASLDSLDGAPLDEGGRFDDLSIIMSGARIRF